MVKQIVARKVGGSVGTTLPKDMAERYHISPGDRLFAVETPDGILLTPYDPLTRDALRIAADASRRFRNALRELAR